MQLATNSEGTLSIMLGRAGHRVRGVEISSNRPLSASSMFTGKDPQLVLSVLPRVFSVCGVAQGCAAAAAIGRAGGEIAAPVVAASRDILLLAETAREHLWRVLIDWPRLRGEPTADAAALAGLGAIVPTIRAALFGDGDPFAPGSRTALDRQSLESGIQRLGGLLSEYVFGAPPEQWLGDASDYFARWVGSDASGAVHFRWLSERGWLELGTCEPSMLPPLPDSEFAARLGDESAASFIALPTWRGKPRETGPFSRMRDHPAVAAQAARHGNGLGARLTARLVELAGLPGRMLDLSQRLDSSPRHTSDFQVEGRGVAQVEAARGRLAHYVSIEQGRIAEYRILAPTEWNFHPRGVAAKGLASLAGERADIELRARCWLGAVDPCVEYQLRIE